MVSNILPDTEVGNFCKENFVCFKAKLEERKGAIVCGKFNVRGYPTLLFLDSNGKELSRMAGSPPDAVFFINLAKKALGTGVSFEQMLAKYQAGERDIDFIRDFISSTHVQLNSVSKNKIPEIQKLLNNLIAWYFYIKRPRETVNKKDFAIISAFFDQGYNRNPFVEYIYNNYEAYRKIIPEDKLNSFIVRCNNISIHNSYSLCNLNWKAYLEDIKGRLAPAYGKETENSYCIMKYVAEGSYALHTKKDIDSYMYWEAKTREYCKKIGDFKVMQYGAAASNIHHIARDIITPKQCKAVIKMLKEGVKLDPKVIMLHTCLGDFYLLLKDIKNAKKSFDKVLELSKDSPYRSFYEMEIEEKLKNVKQ